MKRKLSTDQIEGIRQRLKNNDPVRQIAQEEGVDRALISRIKRKITYDDLDPAEWVSLAELSKYYSTGPERIKHLATLAGYAVQTHRNKRYVSVQCVKQLIEPFFSQEWIPINACSKLYGPTVSTLKDLAEKQVLPAFMVGQYWYLRKDVVETYFEPRKRLVTLAQAAKHFGYSRERFRQFKEQGRLPSITPIGGRDYVDIDQTREVLEQQKLLGRGGEERS